MWHLSFLLLKAFFFFFLTFILNWRIIALQYSVGFCHVSGTGHKYAYVPSILSLPPTSLPSPPLEVASETVELPLLYRTFHYYLFYIWWHIHFNAALSSHPTISFPCCVHNSVLSVCVSILALHRGLSLEEEFEEPWVGI